MSMFYTVFIAKRFQHPVPSKVVIEEVMKGETEGVTKGEIEGVTRGETEGVMKGEIEGKVNEREC